VTSGSANAAITVGTKVAQLAQVGVVGLGALYAIGLLIVNLDLARHGVVSLDLGRPEYVMAGGLWVFITVLTAWSLYGAVTLTHDVWQESVKGLLRSCFIILALISAVPFVLFTALRYDDLTWKGVGLATVVVELNGLMALGAAMWLNKARTQPLSAIFTAHTPATLPRYLPGAMLALTLYATIVSPNVAKEFGGGRKPTIYVFLTEMPPVNWVALGYGVVPDARMIGPVALLMETTGQIVVTPADSKFGSVGIDKRIVSTIVYAVPRAKAQPREVWQLAPSAAPK
jgi:hypothetical protein